MPICEHCGAKHDMETRFCPSTGKLIAESLLPSGTVIDNKYRIGRVLGSGGMGAVFEATHTLLNQRVAIKVLLPNFVGNNQMSERLIREARAASATRHPNITLVTDMGKLDDGGLFVVMEYLAGETIAQKLDRGKISQAESLGWIDQVLSGLAAVHRKGIIHRDLKPENVMITHDENLEVAKILDFGISKLQEDGQQRLTQTGLIMGTPQYMAPEQLQGVSSIDARADIYAAGALLYHMLSGHPPHEADTLGELAVCILKEPPKPLSEHVQGISPALNDAVLQALAKKPDQRPQNAVAFRDAIAKASGCAPTSPATDSAPSSQATLTDPPSESFQLEESSLVRLDEITSGKSAPRSEPSAQPSAQATLPPSALPSLLSPADRNNSLKSPTTNTPRFAPPSQEPLEVAWERVSAAPSPSIQSTAPSLANRLPEGSRGSEKTRRLGGRWLVFAVLALLGATGWSLYRKSTRKIQAKKKEVVLIEVETVPESASIFVDGEKVFMKRLFFEKASTERELLVMANGYDPYKVTFRADRDQIVSAQLERSKPAAKKSSRRRRAHRRKRRLRSR